MNRALVVRSLLFALTLTLFAGCGGSAAPDPPAPAPLSAGDVNLIFVVSEDLAFQAPDDINLQTANLTSKGLQRSLLLASFLKQRVLGGGNATGVYAVEPMTHLQTPNEYPDMVALETVQQFAMLNQIDMFDGGGHTYTGHSYPINASYGPGFVPSGVAPPTPLAPCANCQGLDFKDQGNNNEALLHGIINAKTPGYYVFSAPWETTQDLLARINHQEGYKFAIPASYAGPNYVYAISITPSGAASLTLQRQAESAFLLSVAVLRRRSPLPATRKHISDQSQGRRERRYRSCRINTNETVYMIRHAEAHPKSWWEDGNYVGCRAMARVGYS